MRKLATTLITTTILATSLALYTPAAAQDSQTDAGRLSPAQAKSIIAGRAREVVRQGMDWSSLWMAFETQGQVWYLVGIATDEWTI